MPRSRGEDPGDGPMPVFPSASGRAVAIPRLLELDGRGELTAAHVRLVAQALGKSERTVWWWLAAARKDHRLARVESSHFTVTAEVRRLLALWGGNASRVVEEMFLVSLPRYTGRQKLTGGRVADPDAPPLTYEAFVGLLLDRVTWWNTHHHHPDALNGKTPIEAWQADATPLTDVSAMQLATFALEDNGRTYTISTSGVRWCRRDYLAPWMNGRTGTRVSVRHLPHHDDTIEVFDAATGCHLGSAFLAAAASREQLRSVQTARTAAARRLKADLKAAEKLPPALRSLHHRRPSPAAHLPHRRASRRRPGRGRADGPSCAGPSRFGSARPRTRILGPPQAPAHTYP